MSLDKGMSFLFEDSNRIIKFWSLADNNLCLNCKIQSSLQSQKKMSKLLHLTTKLESLQKRI